MFRHIGKRAVVKQSDTKGHLRNAIKALRTCNFPFVSHRLEMAPSYVSRNMQLYELQLITHRL
jgi:hypothetical protein